MKKNELCIILWLRENKIQIFVRLTFKNLHCELGEGAKLQWKMALFLFATGVNDTGGKWKKSSIRKIQIILFGHLWLVEETYI
jgi:hypothetical protein